MSKTDLVLLPEISMPISCIASTTIEFNVPGSSPALSASNASPQISFMKASAIWLRALLWMQMKMARFFVMTSAVVAADALLQVGRIHCQQRYVNFRRLFLLLVWLLHFCPLQPTPQQVWRTFA